MISVDSYQTLSHPLASRNGDSASIDGSGSTASDRVSLTESITSSLIFNSTSLNTSENGHSKAAAVVTRSSTDESKSSRFSIFKDKNISTANLFQLFDGDITRISHQIESNLTKHVLESEKHKTFESGAFENYSTPINSQLADIRLMLDCEKDCSLLENQNQYQHGFVHDRILKFVLNEFDMRVMLIVLNQYTKANANLTAETGKNK